MGGRKGERGEREGGGKQRGREVIKYYIVIGREGGREDVIIIIIKYH